MSSTPASQIAEEWPSNDVVLYELCGNEQALLYEYAESLATSTYLKMCQLPFRIEGRTNAQYMSPSGRVPFIRIGDKCIADFEPIVDEIARRGLRLSSSLTDTQRADMHAIMAAVHETLLPAEIWLSWRHAATLRLVTYPRYSCVYPWPLNAILPRQKRAEMCKELDMMGWHADRSVLTVLNEISQCCQMLSTKLEEAENAQYKYFCLDTPCELDAYVFGHLYTLQTTSLPEEADVQGIISKFPNLENYLRRIERKIFLR